MGGGAKGKLFEISIMKQLRNNYALLPIVVAGAFGLSLSAFAIVRTLSKSPDVKINRFSSEKPYERLLTPDGKPVQYKYFSTLDYSKLPQHEKPKLD
ncbi:unnamed protein product [Brachionus calyciflorus]|uniref:Uncharacterized protein n=1 Tax=Brachionus calyciflorus TaxID=104777 RepID=A0A813M736_9BILA|nr:unnamed protein product [Brachionus calyciflorus]